MKQHPKLTHGRPKRPFPQRLLLLSVALLLMLQGCIKIDPAGDGATDTSANGSYLYETMTFTYKTNIAPALPAIATGMSPAYLLLVNKSNALGESYAPDELVTLTCPTNGGKTVELEARAAEALYAMLSEMRVDGVTDLSVTSGYRTYAYQSSLLNHYMSIETSGLTRDAYAYFGEDYIRTAYLEQGKTGLSQADAQKVVASYSAPPGKSEHQSGLCVDFVTSTAGLTEAFENTQAFTWLQKNCHRFGFILRYPKDKVSVTEYSYEPWHYRFVGREAATEIMLRGLCLEEFLG